MPMNFSITTTRIAQITIIGSLRLLNGLHGIPAAEPLRPETPIEYGVPQHVCDLKFDSVKESSGLAVSRLHSDVFWTHNDSGGEPNLYAFDTLGNSLGVATIVGAEARDWEDLASFVLDGRPYLLVGDVGDNRRKRTEYQLYVVRESLPGGDGDTNKSFSIDQTIRYQYDRGPRDCESVAIDPTTRQLLFVTKNWSLTAEVFMMDWPAAAASELVPSSRESPVLLTAKFIGKINVPGATAMDISPDGTRAVVLCYGNAYEYRRAKDETWPTAFARPAREIKMPERKQGETVCFGSDGRTLFLTSEHLPTPLFCVAPISGPASTK